MEIEEGQIYDICGTMYQVTKVTGIEARGVKVGQSYEITLFYLESYERYVSDGTIKLVIITHELWI